MSRVDRYYNNGKASRRTVKNQNLYQDLKDYTNLKEEVLNRYDKIELQNIIEKLEEDYVLECISNDINPPEELYKNKDLYNQNIAISVINNYLNCKKMNKTK